MPPATPDNQDDMIKYLHSNKETAADIYTIFDAIMRKGIKELFIQENVVTSEDKYAKVKKEQLF